MKTRRHVVAIELPATPERVFEILHTPSAIRSWWGAARAIVMPRQGGVWAAAWGDQEDDPDYLTIARLAVFDPPRRLAFADCQYHAKSGPLPFDSSALTIEFQIESRPAGALLRVVQAGFPADSRADAFYEACETGWQQTFEGIRRFLAVP